MCILPHNITGAQIVMPHILISRQPVMRLWVYVAFTVYARSAISLVQPSTFFACTSVHVLYCVVVFALCIHVSHENVCFLQLLSVFITWWTLLIVQYSRLDHRLSKLWWIYNICWFVNCLWCWLPLWMVNGPLSSRCRRGSIAGFLLRTGVLPIWLRND